MVKCLYNNNCAMEKTDTCGNSCIRYKEMQFMLNNSLIPANRQLFQKFNVPTVDKDVFAKLEKVSKNSKEYVDRGVNFVLYSENAGNGKTSWAINIMLNYFDSVWAGNGFKERGYFLHVPTFLNKIKQSMSTPDEQLEKIRTNVVNIDLLILDDLGTTAMSNFDIGILESIIDQRSLNGKSTIVTTNRNAKQLAEEVGGRIADRLCNCGVTLHFRGESARGIL